MFSLFMLSIMPLRCFAAAMLMPLMRHTRLRDASVYAERRDAARDVF